ncbi:DUF1850 domain-containing protein [Thermovenabulum sp.]|uniref:DUF1850 domain-containing protein n=1 Tax=Thermovenabulum sp. TaxID=3100335 RepID=UPI003C7AD6B4
MRRKAWVFIFLLILLIIVFISNSLYFIVISSNEKTVRIPSFSNTFSIIFVHSSEKQPWEDIFEIKRGKLVLKTMKVASIGPGVPSNIEDGWTVKIKDGFIIYDRVNKEFDFLDIKLSNISPHYLKIGSKKINLVNVFKDNAVIRIRAGKLFN